MAQRLASLAGLGRAAVPVAAVAGAASSRAAPQVFAVQEVAVQDAEDARTPFSLIEHKPLLPPCSTPRPSSMQSLSCAMK